MTHQTNRTPRRSLSIGRRRLLGGLTAAGAAGMLLAACGGSDEKSAGTAAGSATSAVAAGEPKRGGMLRSATSFDVTAFDPLTAKAAVEQEIAGYAYSRLLKFKTGVGAFADGTLAGDLAESWEQPDESTVVLRLRDGVKWDQRAPTSGRALTTDDVMMSWNKFAADAVYKTDLSNAASPEGSITALTATDPRTIQIKTAYADAQLLAAMSFWGGLWILPKEAFTGGYDPKTEMRGTGPWLLDKYQPSVGFGFKKNPNFYDTSNYPLMDGIDMPIIVDTAQIEAQFKAKNISFGGGGNGRTGGAIPQTDIITLRQDVKDARIDLDAPFIWGSTISFSWRDSNPYKDARVRQAVSMLIDRDAFIELFNDLKRFQASGVTMRSYWNTPLSGGWGPYWLDPKSDRFGPSASNYQVNIAEAKKLLAAAGYPDGFEAPLTFVAGANYGRDWPQRAEALMAMLAKGGIRARANGVDYTSVWIPQYLRSKGDFDGLAIYPNGSRGDPGQWLSVFFSSGGANNQVGKQFPALDALIAKQRRELDTTKRIAIFGDIQRSFAETMPTVPQGGSTETPTLNLKGLHGPDDHHTWVAGPSGMERDLYFWVDGSLRG